MRKVLMTLLVLLVAAGVYARGDQEAPPDIGVGEEETVYLSPESSPGVQDSVTIPITVTADASRNDVVVAYEITIVNAGGQTVWTETGQDESEQPGFFGRLMQNLGLRERETTLSVPDSREWDGTYLGSSLGADGSPVPDGEYTYTVTVTDSGEFTGTSEPRTVVIDNTPPIAVASAEYDVFSPDGDGRRDTVAIMQEGSDETLWTASILRDGDEVLETDYSSGMPSEYVWDGADLAGRQLEDGEYVYQLSSTDEAGNSFTFSMPAVTIDTAPRPLAIVSDTPAFSPNGDGVKDTVTFTFGSGVTDRLTSAVITVSDESGNELQSVEVGSLIGGPVVFDGYVNAARSLLIPEGTYQVSVSAEYGNGAVREAGPIAVEVDTTPPSGSVSVSSPIFSPEGDGYGDTVVVSHAVQGNDSWRGFAFVPGGEVLATFDFGAAVPESVVYDGTDLDGDPVPDGTYGYQLIGTDAAGNEYATEPVSLTIDRRATTMDIELSRRYFSPNGDGQGDTVTVDPNLSVPRGVESYTLTVMNAAGEELVTLRGRGDLPRRVTWDGRDMSGDYAPEGQYVGELSLVYTKGNRVTGLSPTLTLENTVPTVAVRASSPGFTPDGDGEDETITFTPVVSPADEIVRFTGRLVGLDGTLIGEGETDRPISVTWDGRTSSGALAPEGSYVAILEVEHRNGTIREAQSPAIALGDVTGPRVALMITPQRFSPDGDGRNDTVSMTLAVRDDTPVANWQISVYEPDGDLFYEFPPGNSVIRSVEWDGMNDAGQLVEMAAEYDVRFAVRDINGVVTEGSAPLTVDVLTEPLYGKRRIMVDNVLFEGYTTRYLYWDSEAEAQNVVTLEKMGDILRMFPEYSIEIHGHAVSLLYYDEELSDRENREVLIPLSEDRAEVIRDLFLSYGADEDRFTLYAWGKARPLVPFDNIEERAINRRVEFYLVE